MLDASDDEPGFAILPLDESHRAATVTLATHVFVTREPMTARLGVSSADIRPFIAALSMVAVRERTGIVAVHRATDTLVGFALAKDFTTALDFELNEKIAAIFDLLERVDARASSSLAAPISNRDVLHMLMVGTSYPRERRRRASGDAREPLALAMTRALVATAAAQGYRRCVGECTNARSARVARALGARLIAEVRYDDYIFPGTGERCFAELGERGCQAYLLDFDDAPFGS